MVYGETEAFEFPALTYQFGFVDESGQRVDASTIGLTYDNWYGELLTDNVADWQTITLEKKVKWRQLKKQFEGNYLSSTSSGKGGGENFTIQCG